MAIFGSPKIFPEPERIFRLLPESLSQLSLRHVGITALRNSDQNIARVARIAADTIRLATHRNTAWCAIIQHLVIPALGRTRGLYGRQEAKYRKHQRRAYTYPTHGPLDPKWLRSLPFFPVFAKNMFLSEKLLEISSKYNDLSEMSGGSCPANLAKV